MYSAAFRPTYLFFFIARQPIAAALMIGSGAYYQLDRFNDWGLRSGVRNLRQYLLLFPTDSSRWKTFKQIDLEKRLLLKN